MRNVIILKQELNFKRSKNEGSNVLIVVIIVVTIAKIMSFEDENSSVLVTIEYATLLGFNVQESIAAIIIIIIIIV